MARILIIGSYLSPYVRKVLAVLHAKGLDYEIDPIVPFYGDERFSTLSPIRRVPVLVDDQVALSDSTVIAEYLNERYERPRMMPTGPASRARARWLEEFADTRMGEVFIWRIFNQAVIGRFVWAQTPDEVVVRKAREEELPAVLDYLETQVPEADFLFGGPMTADLALASFFRNLEFSRCRVDAERWPKTTAYVARVVALPWLASLRPYEDLCLRTPILQHREALEAAGAPISKQSHGLKTPRRGVMST